MNSFKTITESWKAIEKFRDEQANFLCSLNPGASAEELELLTQEIGFLPVEVLDSLALHNGNASRELDEDGECKSGIICGLDLLGTQGILEVWKQWLDTDAKSSSRLTSFPANAVKLAYTDPGWIALADDAGGSYVGVDLSPGPTGIVGQVINMGRDEKSKYVLADSWAQFLSMVADDLSNNCACVPYEGIEITDSEFGETSFYHYTDFLIARIKHRSGQSKT